MKQWGNLSSKYWDSIWIYKLFLPVKQWVTSSNAGILADSTISIKDSCQSHTASDLGMTYGLLPSFLTCATSMPNLASKKWTTEFEKNQWYSNQKAQTHQPCRARWTIHCQYQVGQWDDHPPESLRSSMVAHIFWSSNSTPKACWLDRKWGRPIMSFW